MKIWILLPAFNEEDSLLKLLPKISDAFKSMVYEYRVVVVNDGSLDKTTQVLEQFSQKMPVEVITHPINRGLGETERDGFEYVATKASQDDVVMRMDCDDTHEPEYFSALINKILEGYDVVIASRFQKGGGQLGVDTYRAFISLCANLFMRLVFNVKGIKDYSCGFRAYRVDKIKYAVKIFGNYFIQLKGLGFTSTLETIIKLKLLGCSFTEVPFVLKYHQKTTSSKMIANITMLGYFTMAILYHWPFGGWRCSYEGLAQAFRSSPERALEHFSYKLKKRSMISRIGGG